MDMRSKHLCRALRSAVDRHQCSREAPRTRINQSRYDIIKQVRAQGRYACPRCFGSGCAFSEGIAQRLAPTAAFGFTRAALARAAASRAGLAHFVLLHGAVILRNVSKCTKPWRASRVEGFHQMLNDTAARFSLPDTELLFGCGDGMVSLPSSVLRQGGTIDEDSFGPLPALTAAPACDFSGNLPVPSFDYRSGVSWRGLDAKMAKYLSLPATIPWDRKQSTLLWRGRLRTTAQDDGCASASSQYGASAGIEPEASLFAAFAGFDAQMHRLSLPRVPRPLACGLSPASSQILQVAPGCST